MRIQSIQNNDFNTNFGSVIEFKKKVIDLNIKLPDVNDEIRNSEKIEEKAKTLENEKPLLAAAIRNTANQKNVKEQSERPFYLNE